MPAPRDTFVNPLLTNISVSYSNTGFIADSVFPTVTVDKETGIYFVQDDKESLRTPADARRGEFSRANRVSNKLSEATYALEEKSLETPISERVMRNYSDPFDPKKNATNLVTQKLLLQKEIDLANTLATQAGTITDENSAWSTPATDIIGKARTARNAILLATGEDANTVVIGKPALDVILENTAVIERIKYTNRADEATILNALADFMGVSRVLIGKTVQNTAKEGQSASTSYVWGDNVTFLYVPEAAAIETPAAGYCLTLKDARYVDEWYEQDIKTTFVRANDFYDFKTVVPQAMYSYTDVV